MADYALIFESAARTASINGTDQRNPRGVGAIVIIDCTAVASSPSVVFTIQGKDPASGKYYTILVSSAIVGTGTTVLRVHPDLTVAANTIAKDIMPAVWRVIATAGNSNSMTYSVGASLV